jgi:hypothetical protein
MPNPLKIHSTKIVETATGFNVEMILSASADLEATSLDLVQVRANLDTDDRFPRLAELQLNALQHVRDLIDSEIQRLRLAKGRNP